MYRILFAGAALLVPTSLECQRLAPVPPYTRSSIMVGPPAPRFDRALRDRGFPRTYWLEGGVIGGITGGVLGTLWFRGMSESRQSFGSTVAVGMLCGAVAFVPAALIGGQFRKPAKAHPS